MSTEDRGRGFPPRDEEDEGGSLSWSQIRHLLHAPLRRPRLVLLPWGVVFLAALVALFVLPKRYRSTTLILIESEKVPDSFVAKVATQDNARRIENIRAEILSRTRLESVLLEAAPYPELESRTRAVERMRQATSVNPSGSDGFTIEFVHRDARKAQEVTDRLAALFITETVRERGQQVEEAVDFLVAQVNEARRELEKKDAALRAFKEGRMGRLPEQLQTNLATMEMLQREMQTVEESLYLAREKRDALARSAGRALGAPPAAGAAAPDELALLRDQLAQLRNRYTDQHPDVESLRSRIARAEARLAESRAASPIEGSALTGWSAPASVATEQLRATTQDVAKLEARQADLERRVEAIRTRVEETPRTEQELANLTRDYEKLSDNYTALLSKQLEAQMAGRLERRWKGERFRVLDPAHLPEKPDSPRTLRILGLGLALGLLLGLAAALAAELLDPTVKDAEQLQSLLPYPVLARIPHIPSLVPARRP
jgi:polysaccharide chain length determinant protein (PEP-CTERM system associated)